MEKKQWMPDAVAEEGVFFLIKWKMCKVEKKEKR